MPEPMENKNPEEETTEVVNNPFGENTDPNAQPTVEPKAEDKDTGKDTKKFDDIPDDHPIMQKMSEMSTNLSNQGRIIEDLRKNGEPKAEEKEVEIPKEELPFPDVKFSKDLTDEEKDAMTDTEIKLMDDLAKMHEIENKRYIDGKKETIATATKAVDDTNSLVQATAKALALETSGKEDIELTNQIIESVKRFDLTGKDAEYIKARVADAQKLLPTYKAPAEQVKKDGGTVKKTTEANDPFGVQAIVDDVAKDQQGGTFAL